MPKQPIINSDDPAVRRSVVNEIKNASIDQSSIRSVPTTSTTTPDGTVITRPTLSADGQTTQLEGLATTGSKIVETQDGTVVVVNTDKDVYVSTYEEISQQNYITNISTGSGFLGVGIFSGTTYNDVALNVAQLGFDVNTGFVVTEVSPGLAKISMASGFSGQPGPSGFSGYSGVSGAGGASGISGISGFSGYSGVSGFSGRDGSSGYSGVKGQSGFSGFSGKSGFSGYSGVGQSGFSGWSGQTGTAAESGFSGYSGPSGFSGYSGVVGASGYSGAAFVGSSGYSGQSGESGESGESGASGVSGWSGYSGVGSSGFSGFSGYSGTGSSGYSGIPGPNNIINAENDITTATLYPVMVNTAGSPASAKVSTSKIYFNASTGTIYATSKSFNIPHPTIPGKKLIYGSLEGPENGVYLRGRLKGTAIELPDYWGDLVDVGTTTVQLTPVGSHQKLYVKSITDTCVTIDIEGARSEVIDCYFTVFAERKDIAKLQIVV